jgi:hypothetical protein
MKRAVKSSEIPLETFSKVVEAIYDCAIDPTRWQETIRLTAELCQSQVGIISTHDYVNGRSELAYHIGYDPNYVRLHEEKYTAMNPFLSCAAKAARGKRDNTGHDHRRSGILGE